MYLPENVLTFSSQGKIFQCGFKTPPHPDYSLIPDLSGSQSAWASGLLVGIVAKYSGLFPDPPSQNVGRSPGIPYEQALQVRLMTATWESWSTLLLLTVWSEDQQPQHQTCLKCRFSRSLPPEVCRWCTRKVGTPWSLCLLDSVFRTVRSARVCGLSDRIALGGPGFSPCPSTSVANSPLVTSSVLKAFNLIYRVSPPPTISPAKSSHLNPRLSLHFPKPNANAAASSNVLLPESPHFCGRCPTCLLANLKIWGLPSFCFLITQI